MDIPKLIQNKFLNPQEILEQCMIEPTSHAADFGCGPGFFSLPLAKIIGKGGKLHAFDVLPQALEVVEGKAKLEGIENIALKRVNLENEKATKLEDSSIDFVVMKDMLFQNEKKNVILSEAFRILKPQGKAVIVEWNDSDYSIGPDKDVRINEAELREMLEKSGFVIEKQIEAGKFHYAYLIKKR